MLFFLEDQGFVVLIEVIQALLGKQLPIRLRVLLLVLNDLFHIPAPLLHRNNFIMPFLHLRLFLLDAHPNIFHLRVKPTYELLELADLLLLLLRLLCLLHHLQLLVEHLPQRFIVLSKLVKSYLIFFCFVLGRYHHFIVRVRLKRFLDERDLLFDIFQFYFFTKELFVLLAEYLAL